MSGSSAEVDPDADEGALAVEAPPAGDDPEEGDPEEDDPEADDPEGDDPEDAGEFEDVLEGPEDEPLAADDPEVDVFPCEEDEPVDELSVVDEPPVVGVGLTIGARGEPMEESDIDTAPKNISI